MTAPLPAEAMSPHRDTMTVMIIMGCTCNLRQFAGRRKERNGMLTLQKSKKDHQMHLRCDKQHRWKAPEQIAPAPPLQSAQHVTPVALALPRLHPAGSYSAICDSSIPTIAAYLGRQLLLVAGEEAAARGKREEGRWWRARIRRWRRRQEVPGCVVGWQAGGNVE